MKLVLDMGNSRIKWAEVSAGRLSQFNARDYEQLEQVFSQWQQMPVPESVSGCSVASPKNWHRVEQFCETRWHLPLQRVVSQKNLLGVDNAYNDAAALGSDRWAGLIAAHHLYSSAACIVDCGTAVTIDAVSARGQHLGGLIVPGLGLMQSSLLDNTAAIKQQPASEPHLATSPWATNTATAISHGSRLAIVALAEKMALHLQQENDGKVACLLTGGNARELVTIMSGKWIVDDELVLKGVALIAGEDTNQ